MKTFTEWLEEKRINEGIFDSKGAKAWAGSFLPGVGPIIGAQIGYGMGDTKKQPGSSVPHGGQDIIGKAISYLSDYSFKSRVQKLIKMGLSEEDAMNYSISEKSDENFKTREGPGFMGRPGFAYYKQKYPNVFK